MKFGMDLQFLVDTLERKKKYLEMAIQYVEAGMDDTTITKKIGKEIERINKRIEDLKK